MINGSFELSVTINRDGRSTPLREFGHSGHTYIEARNGQKFTLKFKNNQAHRVLAVPSIDGLSVLDGKPATAQSRGYIVPAYSSVEINGWRTSLEDVNEFVFTEKSSGKTYAEGTGNGTENCGVLGVKVFEEKLAPAEITLIKHTNVWPSVVYPLPALPPRWPYWYEYWHDHGTAAPKFYRMGATTDAAITGYTSCLSQNNALSSEVPQFDTDNALSSEVPQFDTGTAFGDHLKSKVDEESFERGKNVATLTIYYASAKALAAIGIDVNKKVTVSAMPQAFTTGFCASPVTR